MTVGPIAIGNVTASYGFDDSPSVGTLSHTTFSIGVNTYTIRSVEVPIIDLSDSTPGDLRFDLSATGSLTTGEEAALRLYVCDTHFDFNDAVFYPSGHTYIWQDDLDWSTETTRTLYLSLPANNPATGAPTITGTAQVEQELTADASPIEDTDGLTGVDFTYQWLQVDSDGTSNPVDITDANAATYTLTDDDVGKKVKVKVSFTDNLSGEEERTSAAYPSPGTVTAASTTNTPPAAADNTVTAVAGTAYAFEADDFGFDDADAGDALASVKIVTLPAVGTLALDGTAVTLNQVVTKAQIDGDMLTFTPVAGASGTGYASFTFKVNDGTVDSASAYTMTIDATAAPVTNNAPVFSSSNVSRSIAENTAAGQNVGAAVTATDADAGDTLAYTLGGADAASFDFVGTSGQIRTKTNVSYDFEAKSSYAVTVRPRTAPPPPSPASPSASPTWTSRPARRRRPRSRRCPAAAPACRSPGPPRPTPASPPSPATTCSTERAPPGPGPTARRTSRPRPRSLPASSRTRSIRRGFAPPTRKATPAGPARPGPAGPARRAHRRPARLEIFAPPRATARMTLAWMAPANTGGAAISKYQYRARRTGTTAWTPDWTDVPDGSDPGGSAADETRVVVSGLTNGTRYRFEVRAVNSIGEGPAATIGATPAAGAVRRRPGAVVGLTAAADKYADDRRGRHYGRVTLIWSPSAGDDNLVLVRFEHRYAEDDSVLPAEWTHGPSDRLSQTIDRLKLDTLYIFEVRAVSIGGPGPAVRRSSRTPERPAGMSLFAPRQTATEGGTATFEVRRADTDDTDRETFVMVGVTDSAFPDIPALGGPHGSCGAGCGAGGRIVKFQPDATSATGTITVEFDGARPYLA